MNAAAGGRKGAKSKFARCQPSGAVPRIAVPMAETIPAVEITGLVKDFKTSFRQQLLRAVDGVSIRIMPGEV